MRSLSLLITLDYLRRGVTICNRKKICNSCSANSSFLTAYESLGDQDGDGGIEKPTQKEAWMPDAQSGILQVRCCISYLNLRMLHTTSLGKKCNFLTDLSLIA